MCMTIGRICLRFSSSQANLSKRYVRQWHWYPVHPDERSIWSATFKYMEISTSAYQSQGALPTGRYHMETVTVAFRPDRLAIQGTGELRGQGMPLARSCNARSVFSRKDASRSVYFKSWVLQQPDHCIYRACRGFTTIASLLCRSRPPAWWLWVWFSVPQPIYGAGKRNL